ncbi:MAG TPA: NAD(P)/FAD-dependent oxidoreductase [Gaiellaceae bacterium]|nr:NAD(P)/FAD-dependent oxidoreductase [Gaiellaceae bacterium]
MYDAIIVGARVAGAPTAMLLARKSHRVLLVDRASFPSDTLSTHYIHQPGVARLRRWGLLDRLITTGCPPSRSLVFDVGPFALTGAPPPSDGVAEGYAPRRTVLDSLLVEAAAAAGAEVRTGFTVDELVFEDGAVVGIRNGTTVERARVVIGADGRNSFVARSVQAPEYDTRPGTACAYYTYWAGVEGGDVELYPREGRMVMGGARTNDGLNIVIVFWPKNEFRAVRTDVERSFHNALALAPPLAERLATGERADRFYGIGDLPFYYRKPHGPGWALVGDAGYHKDPITAQGITDAFRDAELLADALHAGFTGTRPPDEALADYERTRNEETRGLYELTYEFASLAPPTVEQQTLFDALRTNNEDTNRFFGVVAGTVRPDEFFAPENLGRILGAPVPA